MNGILRQALHGSKTPAKTQNIIAYLRHAKYIGNIGLLMLSPYGAKEHVNREERLTQ